MANTPKKDRREYHRQRRLRLKQEKATNADIMSAVKVIDEKSNMLSGEITAAIQAVIAEEIEKALAPYLAALNAGAAPAR
jgi:hypothetical protein